MVGRRSKKLKQKTLPLRHFGASRGIPALNADFKKPVGDMVDSERDFSGDNGVPEDFNPAVILQCKNVQAVEPSLFPDHTVVMVFAKVGLLPSSLR